MFDPVQVTKELIAFNSISANSNAAVSDYIQDQLDRVGFQVERITYQDDNGVEKVNLVGRKGEGKGGLALLGHSDTVPVDGWETDPFAAEIRDNRIYGRGSCDMKGALSTMLAAGAAFEASELSAPIYLVFTADEEVGCWGAAEVSERSELLAGSGLRYGSSASRRAWRSYGRTRARFSCGRDGGSGGPQQHRQRCQRPSRHDPLSRGDEGHPRRAPV